MLGHEVEHPRGQLVMVHTRVPRRGDGVHGPRVVSIDEQLVLLPTLTLQPVVDRIRGDRSGQRAEVLRRCPGYAGELLEAPVRHRGLPIRRVA
jgi:hypothetical protein